MAEDEARKRLIELSEGVYVEDDVLGIVERIQSTWPSLRVQYLAGRGRIEDTPYRIMEMCPDGVERMVMGVWELDERVLDRIRAADTTKHDVLGRIDAHNQAVRESQRRRFREEVLGEARELTEQILRSPKTEYTIPGQEPGEVVVIHSHQPSKTKTRTGLERQ